PRARQRCGRGSSRRAMSSGPSLGDVVQRAKGGRFAWVGPSAMIPPSSRMSNSAGYSLFLGLFLATLDTSIVATALVTILDEYRDFTRAEWIVLAYLLTYMSR